MTMSDDLDRILAHILELGRRSFAIDAPRLAPGDIEVRLPSHIYDQLSAHLDARNLKIRIELNEQFLYGGVAVIRRPRETP